MRCKRTERERKKTREKKEQRAVSHASALIHRTSLGFFLIFTYFFFFPHSFFLLILIDLDIVAVSTGEQKAAIIPSVDVGMENLPMPPFPSTLPQTSSSSTTDNSPSTESRPNWYDDGSTATCIDQTSPLTPQQELREIPNDQLLHEVDFNGVNDEFFLFSPGNNNDDQSIHSISDEQQDSIESPLQTSKRIYTVENQIFNDDLGLMDEFHCSSTVDPFGSNHNNNNSSMMITNLDDILIDDDDDEDEELKDPSNYLLNTNYRRPIQEDILYEVEHENSYSDHSQNTSSIVMPDNNVSIFSLVFVVIILRRLRIRITYINQMFPLTSAFLITYLV